MCEEETESGEIDGFVPGPPAFAKKQREAADRSHGEPGGCEDGGRNGIEDDGKVLENTKGNGDNDFFGRDLGELAPLAREYVNAATLPLDSLDGPAQFDASACFTNLACKKLRKAVVAAADTEKLIAM